MVMKYKPDVLSLDKDEVFDFLEAVRESGVTNMLGAAPYIQDHLGCSKEEARYWLLEWIESYQLES